MTTIDQFLCALAYCLFILILGIIFQKYPPKKINHFYGYRTRRSMANQVIWKAANTYANRFLVRIAAYSFAIPVASYFMFPEYNLFITIVGNTVLLMTVLWFTETYLNKHFDKYGNPK
ncbi:SdpI family protein [Jejudonia soesokkakensis]|uniref:SdpI family protein n=1 Tax=Jejudonia soesokkakensis TaxID=1323432 RepID=A0ABW2MV86_9FLAO